MRGRKVDSDFLTEFITECVSNNKPSTDDIIKEAKYQITVIDNKIKEVEKLRLTRGKLLDVVLTFEESVSNNLKKNDESKALSFFNIQNPHICKFICDNMINSAITLESLYNKGHSIEDVIFCIKQLLEHKVISKAGNYLLRGDMFQNYCKYVLQQDVI
jgi:hypothetical protein